MLDLFRKYEWLKVRLGLSSLNEMLVNFESQLKPLLGQDFSQATQSSLLLEMLYLALRNRAWLGVDLFRELAKEYLKMRYLLKGEYVDELLEATEREFGLQSTGFSEDDFIRFVVAADFVSPEDYGYGNQFYERVANARRLVQEIELGKDEKAVFLSDLDTKIVTTLIDFGDRRRSLATITVYLRIILKEISETEVEPILSALVEIGLKNACSQSQLSQAIPRLDILADLVAADVVFKVAPNAKKELETYALTKRGYALATKYLAVSRPLSSLEQMKKLPVSFQRQVVEMMDEFTFADLFGSMQGVLQSGLPLRCLQVLMVRAVDEFGLPSLIRSYQENQYPSSIRGLIEEELKRYSQVPEVRQMTRNLAVSSS